MYDVGKIVPGLVIFAGLVTFPLWYNAGRADTGPVVSAKTPAILAMADKGCVLPAGDMRTSHMQLLSEWRTQAVRDGNRLFTTADGQSYSISLQNTCLDCHSNESPAGAAAATGAAAVGTGGGLAQGEFCTSCHSYMGVAPDCWQCHLRAKEGQP